MYKRQEARDARIPSAESRSESMIDDRSVRMHSIHRRANWTVSAQKLVLKPFPNFHCVVSQGSMLYSWRGMGCAALGAPLWGNVDSTASCVDEEGPGRASAANTTYSLFGCQQRRGLVCPSLRMPYGVTVSAGGGARALRGRTPLTFVMCFYLARRR